MACVAFVIYCIALVFWPLVFPAYALYLKYKTGEWPEGGPESESY